MKFVATILLLSTLLVAGAAQRKAGLPTNRPYNIAHRGASGLLPEHTVEAYQKAIDQGADFIECDVVLTKDLVPVCRHEPDVKDTTDGAEKFADRMTTYEIDGSEVEGIFTVDLTLEELKTLRAIQPRDFRDPNFNGKFLVPTLEEYIDVALGADHAIGIYPETKHPSWHNSLDIMPEGKGMSDIVLEVLLQKGYGGDINSENWAKQPVFIQSFEVGNLKYLSGKTDMPLVQLMGGWEGYVTPDTNLTHEEFTTAESLDDIATYASGVGPWKSTIIPENEDGTAGERTDLVEKLHVRGLQVHPYTFRNEDRFLLWDWGQDMRAEYDAFFNEIRVNGVFTDFPGSLAAYFKSV
ncbi:hypothetical protein BSKO_08789 [Bryopsis sp. KO-2023]|nr:hypothetical protein BSKO_08789 [Bryopsis sp. KO-2023]